MYNLLLGESMKKLRILKNIFVRTKTDKIIISYLIFIFAVALVIQLVEPDINSYGDALWYCYTAVSTIGFGDIIAQTFIGRIASVALTVYSIIAVAIITGVIVNFYNQIIEIQQKDTIASFVSKMERLPELSEQELEEMAEQARKFNNKIKKKANE